MKSIFILTGIGIIFINLVMGVIPSGERDALVAFYNNTGGPNWTHKENWLGPPGSEATWYGITLNSSETNVVGITLENNHLVGSIPAEMADLTALEWLSLNYSLLNGAIPTQLCSLVNLQRLELCSCALSGGIPSQLGNLRSLIQLNLAENSLSGPIPSSLADLANLEELNLYSNNLSGSLPAGVAALPKLQVLMLSHNTLGGEIPANWVNLNGLQTVDLTDNEFSGVIPSVFGELIHLKELRLGSNYLSGSIPASLNNLMELELLDLGGNQLAGLLPTDLSKLPLLRQLLLGDNQLFGSIPKEWGTFKALELLYLVSNRLDGYIPAELGNISTLTELQLAGNQLGGDIPATLGNLTNLNYLNLCGNQLSGSIPPQFGQLTNLKGLNLAWNQLSGGIPTELSQLHQLEQLDLSFNHLSGQIPASLGGLAALKELYLNANGFTGFIPTELGNLTNLVQLELFGNSLGGQIPPSLTNLINLQASTGLDLRWNALYTSDPALQAFLDSKQRDERFELTQTLAPADIMLEEVTPNTAKIHWTPVTYREEGGYEIWSSGTPGGPYTQIEVITTKNGDSYLGCLCTGNPVYFVIRSFTLPHGMNPNRVTSNFGPELTATPTGTPTGFVQIHYNQSQHGGIFPNSPSQIIPSTYLTFEIKPGAFSAASAENPALIMIALPPGASLSQTLADGGSETTSPLPTGDENVLDLAVGEYNQSQSGKVSAVRQLSGLTGIGPHAVQLFHYMEREHIIVLRINESTAAWPFPGSDKFLGFTIGIGGGFWPETESTNWGSSGLHEQPSTLFYMDLRYFKYTPPDQAFLVSVCSYYQKSIHGTGVVFTPASVNLFTVDQELQEPPQTLSSIGRSVSGMASTDLNGDGFEDILVIDAESKRLCWAFGQQDGTFQKLDWRNLTGFTPATINIADVNGDGKAEILIGDTAGALHIYEIGNLLSGIATSMKLAEPETNIALAGTPSAALVGDINKDGQKEYLYTLSSDNTMRVLSGTDYSTVSTYTTGTSPVAMAFGDFDGDNSDDVAVANSTDNSVTTFYNDGNGNFTSATLSSVGNNPASIDSGDFNQDGLNDLAVALVGDKALAIYPAAANRAFDSAHAQKIYFAYTPSAIQVENFDGENGPDVLVGYSDYYKLALCITTDSSGTLEHRYNIDTRGDVEVDPINGKTSLESDRIISVVSGTSYGGVASRQGVAAIHDKGVGVLHFPGSKDLSFAVVNLGSGNSTLTMELYDDQSGSPLKAVTQAIPPATQFARYISGVLGSMADSASRWVRGFAASTGISGFWLTSNAQAATDLDGGRILDARDARTELAFPVCYTGSGSFNSITLINPNKSQARVVLRQAGSDGALKGSDYSLIMAGRSRKVLDPLTIFSSLTETDSLHALADQSILGIAMFGDAKSIACLEGLPVGTGTGVLYCPHVACGNFGVQYKSDIVLHNTGSSSANIQATLYTDGGTTLASKNLTLPANGKELLDVATVFNQTGSTSGYARIDPGSATGIVGGVIFGDAGSGKFLSCLPLQRTGHNKYLLGHIANGTIGTLTYFTGIAILNPETNTNIEIPIQISAYDQTGLLLDSRTITLNGLQRSVFLLNQLMPRLTSIFGGYIIVENKANTSGILVFELFGDASLQLLSAVPAIPLDESTSSK